jgi:hypothetical protein
MSRPGDARKEAAMTDWVVRLARWFGSQVAQIVPENIAVCEFECRETTCISASWRECRRRREMRPGGREAAGPVLRSARSSASDQGHLTTYSGERCIYHSPGGEFYRRTKPERCYVTAEEAVKDGCRRSRLL